MAPIIITDATGENTIKVSFKEACGLCIYEEIFDEESNKQIVTILKADTKFDADTSDKFLELLRIMKEGNNRKNEVEKYLNANPCFVEGMAIILDCLPALQDHLKEYRDAVASNKWKRIIEIHSEVDVKKTVWLHMDSIMSICPVPNASKKRKENDDDNVYMLKVYNCTVITDGEGVTKSEDDKNVVGLNYLVKDKDRDIPRRIMESLSQQMISAVQANDDARFGRLCHFIARNKAVLGDLYDSEILQTVFDSPKHNKKFIKELMVPDVHINRHPKNDDRGALLVLSDCNAVNGVVSLKLIKAPEEPKAPEAMDVVA